MDKLLSRAVSVLKFLGVSLLIDLGLLAAVGLSCIIGTRCTRLMWSERMFWVGMIPLMIGLGGMIRWLGSGRRPVKYKSSDEQETEDDDVSADVRPYDMDEGFRADEDGDAEGLSSGAKFALRMASVGAGAYILSALIDVLTR
jgi:hypothetical protein